MKGFAFIFLLSLFRTIAANLGGPTEKAAFVHAQVNGLLKRYEHGKEHELVNLIWPSFRQWMPERSVEMPDNVIFEGDDEQTHLEASGKTWNYKSAMCTLEGKIDLQLEDVYSIKVQEVPEAVDRPRAVVEVKAEVKIYYHEYKMYQKIKKSGEEKDEYKGPLAVSLQYAYDIPLTLILDIPRISVGNAKCLINIQSVAIPGEKKLSEPDFTYLSEKDLSKKYWDKVSTLKEPSTSYLINELMSIAIRRAIKKKVQTSGDSWICLTKELEEKINEDEKFVNKAEQGKVCTEKPVAE